MNDEYEHEYGGIRNERGSTEPTRNEKYPKHVFTTFPPLLIYSPPPIGRQNELGPSQLLVCPLLPSCRRLLRRSLAVLLAQVILKRKNSSRFRSQGRPIAKEDSSFFIELSRRCSLVLPAFFNKQAVFSLSSFSSSLPYRPREDTHEAESVAQRDVNDRGGCREGAERQCE